MTPIRSFSELRQQASRLPHRLRLAVAHPSDDHTLTAVVEAIRLGFVHAILVGECDENTLATLTPEEWQHVERRPAENAAEAMKQAVQLVHDGQADILMKGMVNTDDLMRQVLNKEYGLRLEGEVITHLAVFETHELDRLLFISDVSVIPQPSLEQRAAQVRYTTQVARAMGIATPRVAFLHFCEKVSERFPITLDYVQLKERASKGEFGSVLIDGPLDFVCAISPDHLAAKRIASPLGGQADILLMPDIQAGNMLYKLLPFFSTAATSASLLCGTTKPVVLTSRGDSIETKINSLALAALLQ